MLTRDWINSKRSEIELEIKHFTPMADKGNEGAILRIEHLKELDKAYAKVYWMAVIEEDRKTWIEIN